MNCMRLIGQKLAAVRPRTRTDGGSTLTFDRQTAEIQVRIAILNRFTALGIPVTQPVG